MPSMNNWKSKFKECTIAIVSDFLKYCARNQTKAVTDLYIGNYKTLLRGIKKDLNKWRESLLSWIRRYSIVI